MAQARDRRGRWTSGGGWAAGGSLNDSNSRAATTGVGRKQKFARTTRISGGIGVRPSIGQARRSVGTYGNRKGSPLGGNKNIRYVSRTQSVIGRAGRPVSAAGVRRTSPPKSGYVVGYAPRT